MTDHLNTFDLRQLQRRMGIFTSRPMEREAVTNLRRPESWETPLSDEEIKLGLALGIIKDGLGRSEEKDGRSLHLASERGPGIRTARFTGVSGDAELSVSRHGAGYQSRVGAQA